MKCLSRMCHYPLTMLMQDVVEKTGGSGKHNGDMAA